MLNTDNQQTIDYNNDANIRDFDDLETIDYNKDTSLGDLINFLKNSGTQIAVKNFAKNTELWLAKDPTPRTDTIDFDDLETIDYNNDTKISDLNDIAKSIKHRNTNKNAQIAAKKIVDKYKKFARKKSNLPFNLSNVAYAETLQYNNDTNIAYING